MSVRKSNFRRIYGAASWLGAASLFGLITALIEDGIWDAVACAALAIPILAIGWHWATGSRGAARSDDAAR
jgi:hypothetical protein